MLQVLPLMVKVKSLVLIQTKKNLVIISAKYKKTGLCPVFFVKNKVLSQYKPDYNLLKVNILVVMVCKGKLFVSLIKSFNTPFYYGFNSP